MTKFPIDSQRDSQRTSRTINIETQFPGDASIKSSLILNKAIPNGQVSRNGEFKPDISPHNSSKQVNKDIEHAQVKGKVVKIPVWHNIPRTNMEVGESDVKDPDASKQPYFNVNAPKIKSSRDFYEDFISKKKLNEKYENVKESSGEVVSRSAIPQMVQSKSHARMQTFDEVTHKSSHPIIDIRQNASFTTL